MTSRKDARVDRGAKRSWATMKPWVLTGQFPVSFQTSSVVGLLIDLPEAMPSESASSISPASASLPHLPLSPAISIRTTFNCTFHFGTQSLKRKCKSSFLWLSQHFVPPLQLPCSSPVATCRHPVSSLSAPCQLPVSSLSAPCQLPGSSLAAPWQLPGSSLAAPWQLPYFFLSKMIFRLVAHCSSL